MNSPAEFEAQANRVAGYAPLHHEEMDSPYYLTNSAFDALRHVLHDVGGQPALPVAYEEKVEEDWEMSTYVTCECLGWRGVWNIDVAFLTVTRSPISNFVMTGLPPSGPALRRSWRRVRPA